MNRKFWLRLIFVFISLWAFQNSCAQNECTIGVASGKATADGRTLLWKTRDTSSIDNEVNYNTSYKYNFIAVINAGGTSAWMGVNEKGFAILNSAANDLEKGDSGTGNGTLMTIALGTCATMSDFSHLLDSTNVTCRQTQANFGVIDSTGAAAIFETAGYEYWKFDANDSTVAPKGYVLRTNFAFNGDAKNGLNNEIYSIERYRRQASLINDFHSGGSLNYRSIIRYQMRDFSDFESEPVSVPYPHKWLWNRLYGYIYAYVSICRSTSVSAAVIQGVLPGESPKLSTMWTILGQPASAIAVPYWAVGKTPYEADGYSTSQLCNTSKRIKALLFDYEENSNYIDSYKLRDANDEGLWSNIFPAEDSIFTAADQMLEQWRSNTFTITEMVDTEKFFAKYALSILDKAYQQMITGIESEFVNAAPTDFILYQNYPNPFNLSTTIQFYVPYQCFVNLKIYNLLGEQIAKLISQKFAPGKHNIAWDGRELASGIYFYRLEALPFKPDKKGSFIETKKLHLVK